MKNMKKRIIALLLLVSQSSLGQVELNSQLPPMVIEEYGRIKHSNDERRYERWSTEDLGRKIHIIEYMAGRSSSKELNRSFISEVAGLSKKNRMIQLTTIVNLNDSLWGTKKIVLNQLDKAKKKYPDTIMVADRYGVGQKNWQPSRKSSMIIVLSLNKNVVYLKDGKMSEADSIKAMSIIKNQMNYVSKVRTESFY